MATALQKQAEGRYTGSTKKTQQCNGAVAGYPKQALVAGMAQNACMRYNERRYARKHQ